MACSYHCTKKEEILNGKLSFMCSGSCKNNKNNNKNIGKIITKIVAKIITIVKHKETTFSKNVWRKARFWQNSRTVVFSSIKLGFSRKIFLNIFAMLRDSVTHFSCDQPSRSNQLTTVNSDKLLKTTRWRLI